MVISKRWRIFLVASLALLVAIISLDEKLTIAFMLLLFGVFLIATKKINSFLFIVPFIALSFMPSQYSSYFRFGSPIGELRVPFVLTVLVSMYFIMAGILRLNMGVLKEYRSLITLVAMLFSANVISIMLNGLGFDVFRFILFSFFYSFGMLLLVCVAENKINPLKMLQVSLVVSSGVCVIGIMEFLGFQPYAPAYLADREFFNYIAGNGGSLPRIASSVGNPLVLSAYLLLMLPIAFYVKENSDKNVFWNTVIGIHLLTILLTQSRSAFIILAVVVLYFSAKNLKTFVKNMFSLTIVSLIFYWVLSLFGFTESFTDRLLFRTNAESFSHRLEAFDAVSMIMDFDNIFFGIGPNVANQFIQNNSFLSLRTLDNVFLMTFVSVGAVGIFLFLATLYLLFLKFNEMENLIKKTGISMIMIVVGMGFSFNVNYFAVVWGVFWFLSALLILVNYKKQNEKSSNIDNSYDGAV